MVRQRRSAGVERPHPPDRQLNSRSPRAKLRAVASKEELPAWVLERIQREALPLFRDGSERTIQIIKTRHGFKRRFDLAGELRGIAYGARRTWIRDTGLQARQIKSFMRLVRSRVRELRALFTNGTDDQLSLLIRAPADSQDLADPTEELRLAPHELTQLARLLTRLDRAAEQAASRPARLGRRPNRGRAELAKKLRRLYIREFGPNAPRVTKADQYGGPFFEFLKDVLPLFGVRPMGNAALGHVAARAVKVVDLEQQSRE